MKEGGGGGGASLFSIPFFLKEAQAQPPEAGKPEPPPHVSEEHLEKKH